MSDAESSDEAGDALSRRHRREKKELQSQIQALKKSASKGDRKKKKEVNDEVSRLETQLQQRHLAELKEWQEQLATTDTTSSPSTDLGNLASAINGVVISEPHEDEETSTDVIEASRVSKAQKRRDKKAAKEKERLADIDRQELQNLQGLRHRESQKIGQLLRGRRLVVHDIPSDGDCLFASVSHQLRYVAGQERTVSDLRRAAAIVLSQHRDDYLPFMTCPTTGQPMSTSDFDQYCANLTCKPVWGGQIELRALAQAQNVLIEVIQADGPALLLGQEFAQSTERPHLVITYHRHLYSLGEHYNSTVALKDDDRTS